MEIIRGEGISRGWGRGEREGRKGGGTRKERDRKRGRHEK